MTDVIVCPHCDGQAHKFFHPLTIHGHCIGGSECPDESACSEYGVYIECPKCQGSTIAACDHGAIRCGDVAVVIIDREGYCEDHAPLEYDETRGVDEWSDDPWAYARSHYGR